MRYEVLLDRKTITTVALGLAVMATVVFASGFLAGKYWGASAGLMELAAPAWSRPGARLTPPPMGRTPATVSPQRSEPSSPRPDLSAPAAAGEGAPSLPAGTSPQSGPTAPEAGPAGDAPSKQALGPGSGEYSIQAAAFVSEANLAGFIASLKRYGFKPHVVPTTDADGRVLHTVRLGNFANRDDAARVAETLRSHGLAPIILEGGLQ